MVCHPPASLPIRKFSALCSAWSTPIPLTKRWSSCAAAPMAIKHHFLPLAVPRLANFATKLPQEISASISALLRRWPISPLAAGKKVSLEFFTVKDATRSNSLPNRRSLWNAGRARRQESSRTGEASLAEDEEYFSMITKPLHLDVHEQIESAQT